MTSFLLIGDSEKCTNYINNYILKESIRPYEIEEYSDKILIEHARQIIHSISRVSSKKLILLRNEITIEAQNALLKNIEELPQSCTLMICSNSSGDLLSTIQSRCFMINLGQELSTDTNISVAITSYINGKIDGWRLIDEIETSGIVNHDTNNLLQQLRSLVIDLKVTEKQRVFNFCKKLLFYTSLLEKNNVNKRIVLEKVFL